MQSVFDAVPAIEAFYDAKVAPPEPAPEPEPEPEPEPVEEEEEEEEEDEETLATDEE